MAFMNRKGKSRELTTDQPGVQEVCLQLESEVGSGGHAVLLSQVLRRNVAVLQSASGVTIIGQPAGIRG